MPKKLLYFITEDWVFCSHRLPLAVAARDSGYDVAVITHVKEHGEKIKKAGIRIIPFDLDRGSVNPFKALMLIGRLVTLYRREKPDIVHHVAIKPILYGSIAARFARVPRVVNAITGMGYIFTSRQMKARLLRPVINAAFRLVLNRKNATLIMQNDEDRQTLVKAGIVKQSRTVLIRGAGVDTSEFAFSKEPAPHPPLVIVPARVLKDKGIVEFVEAARILHGRGVHARFILAGAADEHNHAAVPMDTLNEWVDSGIVEWWGRKENMPDVLANCHIVCLPSYREGLPKALLEAASCGRPIITTDTVGCREVVRDGENGLLVPLFSTTELADALQRLIESPELRCHMGKKGRNIVEEEFAIEKVISETLAVYSELATTQ
ncbi:MAG: glycosyltransferase family 4 protein [Lentisphaeria bacterium]|nr:glycosyltransferase family 4 protein [Lentisphaeria bacterium]